MPKTEKIRTMLLQPLLEEHNKIANLIRHLDRELKTMLADADPDTDFIEISITLLNNYIRRYHTIEKEIVRHFEEHELNIEEKLKVMTLFNEHRESLPLLDRLIELNDDLRKKKGAVKETLAAIKELCDSLGFLLHKLGKKYFSNILIDDENHVIPNGKPASAHHHRELDIDAEILTADVDEPCDCSLRDLTEDGVTICSDREYAAGELVELRCRNMPGNPILSCEVIARRQENGHFCYDLKIDNIAECRSVIESILQKK